MPGAWPPSGDRTKVNPFVGVNYPMDNARQDVPPAWFLQQLYDFDAMLVVLPSRRQPYTYVIARRRATPLSGTVDTAIKTTVTDVDTQMCFQFGCVPVCRMFKHGATWDIDRILRSLKARDTWRIADELPGSGSRGDKLADMLEAQEEREQQQLRASIREDLYHRSGDGWRTYQARTGQRVSLHPDTTRTGHRAPSAPPSSSTAGSGALWTPRD